jgi:ElaB/YqjD/DUF883 family membrane-anchored ribosome-binding protein
MSNKTASNGEHSFGERLHDAGERLGDFKDDVAKTMGRQVKSLRSVLKEHPVLGVAAAIGIGYLIARLVHR